MPRATTSLTPPAAAVTMMVMVFDGNVCAWAAVVVSRKPSESALHVVVMCRMGFLFCGRVPSAPAGDPFSLSQSVFWRLRLLCRRFGLERVERLQRVARRHLVGMECCERGKHGLERGIVRVACRHRRCCKK